MKKAEAINFVIQKIKDQNRSSFGSEDIKILKRAYSGGLTKGIISDFQAEAIKAGIEAPENLSFEDLLPKRRASAAERKAGVGSGKQSDYTGSAGFERTASYQERKAGVPAGKQVAERATEVAKGGKGLASQSIRLSDEGLTLLLAQIEIDGGSNQTYVHTPRLAAKEHTATNVRIFKENIEKNLLYTGSKTNNLGRVHSRLHKYSPELAQEIFPSIELYDRYKSLRIRAGWEAPPKIPSYSPQIQDAYIQLLYERGWLEDADPDLKDLNKEINSLPKTHRNRGSNEGRPLVDTQRAKGIPIAVGVNADGEVIYDPNKTRPYKLRISEEGKKHLDKIRRGETKTGRKIGKVVAQLPSIVPEPSKLPAGPESSNLPAEREKSPTKSMDERIREDRKAYYRNRAIRGGGGASLTIPVTSERTGKVYDNYNQMVATEGSPPPPGGEAVEPNRGEASRRAKGAVISRRDVGTFKQAMAKAVSKGGKVNLFTEIVNEARKIDPKVSLNAMQDVKDYLFFTGYLEADTEVTGKLGPSRLSDADVPEYVKPTNKYYRQGLKVLDAGGANEPLVIRKLSADPDMQDVARGVRSVPEITGPETAAPDKPVSERTSRLLNIIKGGGRFTKPRTTPPLTDEEKKAYDDARARYRGKGGIGKVGKAILPGALGAGIGAAVSEDAVAGAIEGFFPLGYEPTTVSPGTFTAAEEKKARIRGFPSAIAQQEAEEFLTRDAVTLSQRGRETARMATPPSDRSFLEMD